ncbi:hypothetical protein BJ875DRAFT_18564 [Amylocarpus encephaloides]|uniref:Citrate transporter-like domain-containing protein n=1 Tax=Amylocarpus encephaloides TaxID=45428 RepID=A0A9P7YIX3_9HELO|nr:hypothetical protein BJ875DRAFT_18564 [Amylocarpus encephaloides]
MAGGDAQYLDIDLNTDQIKSWRSIITLIVFVVTNIIVLAPFHVPLFVPRLLYNTILDGLSALRIIPLRSQHDLSLAANHNRSSGPFVRLGIPINIVTAPLIADIFLLAILAIGRKEVLGGTLGTEGISPIDIMIFFITLAYIAISIDASGLIRYLACKVLERGGKAGHRLFLYLYLFFFVLGSFIGNDPIILSGTAFLAYMTQVSSNIVHPRAWIHTQFAIANIASAILVSSNPTNLVLAGAFNVRFIDYTANMIVPVVVTAILLFPCLLYLVFREDSLIPKAILMHELSEESKAQKPVNPNIPKPRGLIREENTTNDGQSKSLSLEEIMNPFLDKKGASISSCIMAITLVTVLALNAALSSKGESHPVFWMTLPAAVVMFSFDIALGWRTRHETRQTAREVSQEAPASVVQTTAKQDGQPQREAHLTSDPDVDAVARVNRSTANSDERKAPFDGRIVNREPQRATFVSISRDAWNWSRETFPTASTVLTFLPFALVPFAFSMFVLVQALVTKGWIPVFAYGWDAWVAKTGTVGAILGMGFSSVVLCNFSGTNIGTTILLSRLIQAWQQIHRVNGIPISDRTFWATVYGMALGVNYGAFSTTFSASLAGMLWRDILARKHIHVSTVDFARYNCPIIAISMVIGCAVLVGEIYIIRGEQPYSLS